MFKFLHDDLSVESGVRRIALSQIDLALREVESIGDTDQGTAIHNARKHFKKLRALLRLVRPATDCFRRENAALRDVAAALSATRDGKVLIETLDGIEDHTRPADEGLKRLRESLSQDYRRLGAEAVAASVIDIRAIRDRAAQWRVSKDGFKAIGPGLRATYRQARRSMKLAERRRSPETIHEWRKAVKHHGYHIALLRNSAPEVLKPSGKLWQHLGERLGDHHDLAMLEGRLNENPDTRAEDHLHNLGATISERRASLENEAFDLGRQLLAETPKAVVRRFEAYWRAWQEGR